MIDNIPAEVGVQHRRTCAVLCTVYDDNGVSIEGATITAQLSYFDVDDGYITPILTEVRTDNNGEATLNLWPNELGATKSFYKIKIIAPNGKVLNLEATVPDTQAERLETIALLPPYPGKPDGFLILEEALAAARRAEQFAREAEGSAQQAGISAYAAGESAKDAKNSADLAKKYAEGGRAMATLYRFGAVLTPEDLPRDGLLRAGSDGAGSPPVDVQFIKGQGMIYSLCPNTNPRHNHLFSYVGVDIDPSGWVDLGNFEGPKGDKGDPGIDGLDGRSVTIVGSFGDVKRPGNLPIDGLIPADWDGGGYPKTAIQVKVGEGMIYNRCPKTYAGYQDVWAFVGPDKSPTSWINLGNVGITKQIIIEKLGYTPADQVKLDELTLKEASDRDDIEALKLQVSQLQADLLNLRGKVDAILTGSVPLANVTVTGRVTAGEHVVAEGTVFAAGDVRAFSRP